MAADALWTRLTMRAGRVLGKDRSLRLGRWIATESRRFAAFVHARLFEVHWYLPPQLEWADHHTTIHAIWPPMRQAFWAERGCVGTLAMRPGADVLSVCCGDGFYDRYFHSGLARHVMAVDYDPVAIAYARQHNAAPNVTYQVGDIRKEAPAGSFDNIVWNGAIEHFTPDEIDTVLRLLKARLKPGGVLSGYTIAENPGEGKQLSHHEYEFKSKEDLLRFFAPHFARAKVFETLYPLTPGLRGGARRHNLYWYAGDGPLPFDEDWPHVASARRPGPGALPAAPA